MTCEHAAQAAQLRAIAADLRSAGDVPLVELSDEGVTTAAITLADELWLIALQLDPDGTFPTGDATDKPTEDDLPNGDYIQDGYHWTSKAVHRAGLCPDCTGPS